MTIKDIGFCPFCGCDMFYVIEQVKGRIHRRIYADENKEAPNHEMYDGLSFYTKKKDDYIFCDNCYKKIAYGKTGELTKSAYRKAIKECEENA